MLDTFQWLLAGTTQEPAQTQHPSQCAAKPNTSCIIALDRNEKVELKEEGKDDEDPKPHVSSPRRSRMNQEDASRQKPCTRSGCWADMRSNSSARDELLDDMDDASDEATRKARSFNPPANPGIDAGLLSMRAPLSTAQAHTHSNRVRNRWRKEYYSVIGTTCFTVPSLVWRERVTQIGGNSSKHPGHTTILRCRMKVLTMPSKLFLLYLMPGFIGQSTIPAPFYNGTSNLNPLLESATIAPDPATAPPLQTLTLRHTWTTPSRQTLSAGTTTKQPPLSGPHCGLCSCTNAQPNPFAFIMQGLKPEPSGNAGIATGLLSVRGALSANHAHKQSNSVRKKWRKEHYSVIGTTCFTVPSLVWRGRVAQSGWNNSWLPGHTTILRCRMKTERKVIKLFSAAVSRKYVWDLDFSHHEKLDPYLNPFQYEFGSWAQRRFDSALEVLQETFKRAVTAMAMRTEAPARTQNASQRASRANTSWIAVLSSNEREELRELSKDDEDPKPHVSSPRRSGMDQEDASRPTTMHEIRLLGGHACKFMRN
ncbi:hypothetical protein HPB51_029599 [Rhipicephalus microplus]|uniref:Uncharacterized protein n=1 Tax=Rhipicephalus microplus TaxID=6941 RepID=A0A9J6CU00_RHIMP|nr:hypothetical protein HPB51_029599 [Rhipicephalus microplus]